MKKINTAHCIYLAGIIEESNEFDGSIILYYWATISIDTNNIEFSWHQIINFDEGKISGIW